MLDMDTQTVVMDQGLQTPAPPSTVPIGTLLSDDFDADTLLQSLVSNLPDDYRTICTFTTSDNCATLLQTRKTFAAWGGCGYLFNYHSHQQSHAASPPVPVCYLTGVCSH